MSLKKTKPETMRQSFEDVRSAYRRLHIAVCEEMAQSELFSWLCSKVGRTPKGGDADAKS